MQSVVILNKNTYIRSVKDEFICKMLYEKTGVIF